jgi:hypothetical protein
MSEARNSAEQKPPIFKPSVLEALLKAEGLKANSTAGKLLAEYLRVFTAEAVSRAGAAANDDGKSLIELKHLKTILAELLLDF